MNQALTQTPDELTLSRWPEEKMFATRERLSSEIVPSMCYKAALVLYPMLGLLGSVVLDKDMAVSGCIFLGSLFLLWRISQNWWTLTGTVNQLGKTVDKLSETVAGLQRRLDQTPCAQMRDPANGCALTQEREKPFHAGPHS